MSFNTDVALKLIGQEISGLSFGNSPENLYAPIRYLMSGGGKRLRPLLVLMGYALFKDDYEKALRPAVALEVFHNFTLVHDDIMDKATLRRGRATVHEKWNKNIAILSGDVMLVKVYELLAEVPHNLQGEVFKRFSRCATQVCEGQQIDMDFEELSQVSAEDYLQMIRLKTAVLPGFCLRLGAMTAGASAQSCVLAEKVGEHLGIGFQLKDDLLDVYGKQEKFGKKIGGDILANKKTFLMVLALNKATNKNRSDLAYWLSNNEKKQETEKIAAVTAIYNGLNADKITQQEIEKHFGEAHRLLDSIPVEANRKIALKKVLEKLSVRKI